MPTNKFKLGDQVIVTDKNSLRYGFTGKIKLIDNVSCANRTRYLVDFQGREDVLFEESLKRKGND